MEGNRLPTALTVNLQLLERMIVGYYTYRHRKTKGAAIRAMIRGFARADKDFAPEQFVAWVERELIHACPG